jgi:hypothetical protein
MTVTSTKKDQEIDMKNSTFFINNLVNISLALWEQDLGKPNLPNQGGNIVVTFTDGSKIKVPMSAWTDPCPQDRRPNTSGSLNKYKLRGEIEQRNAYCGEDPIDNPALIETDRSARVDAVDPKVAAAADKAQRVADLETPKKAVRRKAS